MKRLLSIVLLFLSVVSVWGQPVCDMSSYTSIYRIVPANYPYTSTSGIGITARLVGISTYTGTASNSCSGTLYAGGPSSWYIDNTSDSIILTFSTKVTNFSLIFHGVDNGEQLSVFASSGSVSLSNYCSASFNVTSGIPHVLNATTGYTATLVTINNTAGATQYVLKHNGASGGALINLLDCVTGYKGPADIVNGIQLWLDGSDVNNNPGTNPANGTRLPVWKDISGNGNNAQVLSGQDTARMHTNQINGKDVAQFTRGSQYYGSIYEVPNIDIRATAMPQSTIFTVYRPTTASASDWQGIWGNDNGGWDRFFMPSFGSSDGIVSVGPPANYVSVPGAGTAGETKLLTAVYHSGVTDSSVIYFNALPVARVTDNTHATAAQTRLRIGWDGDDNPFSGDIAEMVVYNRKLTDCEIKAVNRYFGYKYGVPFTSATVTPSAPQYFCSGDTVSLKGAGGSIFQWLKNGVPIAAATDSIYKVTTPGNYAVISGNGGCADTSVVTTVTLVPSTIYVDSSKATSGDGSSWASAKKTLTEALSLAHTVTCPIRIWVKKGTYYPTSGTARDSSFRVLRNNIKIYGGFNGTETLLSGRNPLTNLTRLSGDIGVANDSTDNSFHIMTIVAATGSTIDTNVVVDGFTICDGNATGGSITVNGQFFYHHDGAGIYNVGYGASTECSPLINNCIFKNHTAYYGSALYNGGSTNGKSNPVVRNSTFLQNFAHSDAAVCLNQARFGGQSNPVFTNCTFTANGSPGTGGAFYNNGSSTGSSSPVFSNCTFAQNYSGGNGGAVFSVGSTGYTNAPEFNSCTFSANTTVYGTSTTTRGGALYNSNLSGMVINNCTFLNNTAPLGGGAVCNADGAILTINHSIFSGNTARSGGALQNVNNSSTSIVVNSSIFSGNSAGGTSDDAGGAATILAGTMSFNSTTFSNNTTASTSKPNGNSISTNGSTTLNVTNSVVWGAAANQLNILGTANYTNSLLKGLTVTFPNINTDPLFVNAADPDGADNVWRTADDGLYMLPCSGAVNGGLNSVLGSMTTDITGANRILYAITDMGAYEHNFDSTGRPRISIAAVPGNKICTGDTAYFAATVTGAGATPSYQWYKNGVLVSSSATYGSASFANNDSVWVVLTNTNCNLKDTSKKVVFSVTPPVIYVDSAVAVTGTGLSWSSPYKTLSEALNLANYGSASCPVQVWVKKGTYYPTGNTGRDSSFRINRNNIKLYGGFAGGETLLSARSVMANPTILSGDIGTVNDSADNCYHVMTIQARSVSQIDTNTVIDGFTITGGNGQFAGSFTINGITFNRQDGAGIHIWGASSGNKCTPIIANCTLTRNAANFGGGIYSAGFNSGNASPVVRNTVFSYNKANNSGGGMFNNGQNSGISSPSLNNCTFSYNTAANGGGAYNQASGSGTSDATLSNITFNNNKATSDGGGFFNSYGKPQISNCRFLQNEAGYSGGSYFQQGGKATFTLNVFDQNTAQIAGAIRTYTGDPSVTLFRNVFYRNTSSINDAGAVSLVCANGNDTVINNLFVKNKAFGSGPNGGGAMVQEAGTSSYIVNNTFYADSSSGSGGALHFKAGGTNRYLLNNIFYKSYNGSSATDYNTASGTSVTTESNNLFSNTNPRFVRESNPAGADGTWLTADDGLDLLPCSPAVNTATTAPAADIRNRARVGLPDIGAYEEQGKPLPTAPVAASPISYCQNATAVALTATKTSASDTLKWYNAVPALLPGAPTPSTATTGTFTWYVSQTDSTGCESAKTTINVIIKPTPAAPVATTPVTYCQGATATALTATLAAGSDTLKWYNASMTALSGAPTPSTTTPGTYTYYVSQKTSLNCEGPKTAITVQVNPTPGLPATTTPVTYCQGATAVPLTATASSASDTLRWYNSVPALLPVAPTPSTTTAGTFTFYVSQKNNFSCEGAKKAITVQVNPTPVAPPSASPVTYCQDDVAVALSATKASSTDTLKWYNASMALLSAAPVPSTVSPGTTTYSVSAKTSLGCEGPKTTITVVVNPRPLAPVVVTPVNLCVGIPATPLTASGTSLKWYTTASGGTSSATLTPPTSTVGSTTYYVTQTNTFGCESLRESLTVNVRPSPTVTVEPVGMPAFVFCVGDSITVKAFSATAISYQWKMNTVTLPGSVSDTLHIDTTATYSVVVRDMYGCADTESVFVMKNPLPKPKLLPVDVMICKGVNIILYASPATFGYRYEWFKDGSLMGVDTALDRITVDTTGHYMVRMTDIYNCTVNTNGSSVSQYPEMIKPSIVRTGNLLKLTAKYASYQWYRNGKIISGATSKTYTLSFDGDYHVVVLDANGCEGFSDTIKVYALGIDPAAAQGSIRVYPNPSQGKVMIDAPEKVNVIVTDITGRELLRAQQTREVDLAPFADGIYMLRIFNKEGQLLLNERINKQTR